MKALGELTSNLPLSLGRTSSSRLEVLFVLRRSTVVCSDVV